MLTFCLDSDRETYKNTENRTWYD